VKRSYQSLLLVAGLCAAAYANALTCGFVYDDHDLIVHNPYLTEGHPLDAFRTGYWETTRGGSFYYRPVVSLSYFVDHAVWDLRPFGYHLRNAGIHLVTSLVVLVLATQWLASWGAGLAAAAIFAVHPIHAQSVTWIAGRTDLLAGFAFLAALASQQMAIDAAARFARSPDGKGRMLPIALQSLSLFFLAMALLSKEMAITYPAALLLHAVHMTRLQPGGEGTEVGTILRRWWFPLGAAAGIATFYLFTRLVVLGRLAGYADDPHAWWTTTDGTMSRLLAVPLVLAFYIRRALFPWWYTFESGIRPVHGLAQPALWSALAGLTLLAFLAWRFRRREPAVTFGILFFAVTILPVANVFPIFESAMEHFAYLPSLGLIVAAVAFVRSTVRSDKARAAICCAAVLLLGARTVVRNADWKDEETFWKVTVRDSPSARAWNNLGLVERDEGKLAEAEAAFAEVLRLAPDLPSSHANLGAVLAARGRRGEAIRRFEEALRLDPDDADALYNLALTLETDDRGVRYGPGFSAGAALNAYTRLVHSHPDHAEGWTNLGVLQERMGRPADAALAYENAIRAAPELPEPHAFLAGLLWQRGDRTKAAEEYRAYLGLAPNGDFAAEARARSAPETQEPPPDR